MASEFTITPSARRTVRSVVLVHGLGGRAEDWEKLAPYLAKAGYRVYLPDLPGFGQSDKPANFSYSVTDQSKIVAGFFDVLDLKQVDLGGWSMGGWIVQLVATKHPDRVRRLMLLDSAGLYVKPEWDIRLFTPISPAELEKLDALLMPHPPQAAGLRGQGHPSDFARARLDHPSCDRHHAARPRDHRRSASEAQNACPHRLGRVRPDHASQRGRTDPQAHSTIANERGEGLWSSGTQRVRLRSVPKLSISSGSRHLEERKGEVPWTSPSRDCSFLEADACAELDLAARCGYFGDAAEAGGIHEPVRRAQVGVIERVEELCARLKTSLLSQR